MKIFRLLPVFLLLAFLFAVVSCQDNQHDRGAQPKPKKNGGARTIAPSMAYNQWDAALSPIQQYWFSEHGQQLKNDIYNDEQRAASDLNSHNLSMDVLANYPLFCYQVALLGAYHTRSIGTALANDWVQMTYADPTNFAGDVMYNYNIGEQVAQLNSVANLGDAVYNYMFISGTRYKIPGEVYIGTYNAVPYYTAPYLNYGSFTLPGSSRASGRIYLATNQTNDTNLLRHEFGHILQGEDFGLTCFYTQVVPASIRSAARDGQNGHRHECFKTETDANRRSYSLLYLQYPNTVWNEADYPFTCPNYDPSGPCP